MSQFSNGINTATIVCTRIAGLVTDTKRKLIYNVFTTGVDSFSISSLTANAEFYSEVDQMPPFKDGHKYSLAEFAAYFQLTEYDMVIIDSDGYKRAINKTLEPGFLFSIDCVEETLQLVFTDETVYAEGEASQVDVILRNEFGSIATLTVDRAATETPYSFNPQQIKELFKGSNIEINFILNSTLEQVGQVTHNTTKANLIVGVEGDQDIIGV